MQPQTASFASDKYEALPAIVTIEEATFLRDYLLNRARRGKILRGDALVPEAPAGYGDVVFDTLLEKILPIVENSVGSPVFPTYSYFRLYGKGDRLPRHRDRPACEFSLTLALGYDPAPVWPFWIEAHGKPTAICLEAGAALLYRGTEVYHWRDDFEGNYAAQVFLHYVDQKGPYAEWKFDKRKALGLPAVHS
jgi:hypothetical protein